MPKEASNRTIAESAKSLIRQANSELSDATVENYSNTIAKIFGVVFPNRAKVTARDKSLKWLDVKKNITKIDRYLSEIPNKHSKHALVSAVSAVCLALDFKKAHEHFKAKSKSTRAVRDQAYEDGETAESVERHFVPYTELHGRVEHQIIPEFFKLYERLATKKKIIISTRDDFNTMINGLLGVLNIVEPNVRSALAHCIVLINEDPDEDIIKKHKAQMNYVEIREDGKVFLHIIKDKVIKKMNRDSFELRPLTARIISESMELLPREYLFPKSLNALDKPMSNKTYQERLQALFTFGEKRPGVRSIRHAQASHLFIKYRSPSSKQQKWLARRLRHNEDIMNLVYRSYIPYEIDEEPALSDLDVDGKPM